MNDKGKEAENCMPFAALVSFHQLVSFTPE